VRFISISLSEKETFLINLNVFFLTCTPRAWSK